MSDVIGSWVCDDSDMCCIKLDSRPAERNELCKQLHLGYPGSTLSAHCHVVTCLTSWICITLKKCHTNIQSYGITFPWKNTLNFKKVPKQLWRNSNYICSWSCTSLIITLIVFCQVAILNFLQFILLIQVNSPNHFGGTMCFGKSAIREQLLCTEKWLIPFKMPCL